MTAIKVPVSANGMAGVFCWLDGEDVERLEGRSLSLGSHGYAQMFDVGRVTLVHRWVMGARHRDGKIIDHINGNRLDCRKVNLRIVTASESSSNVKARSRSGYRGVHPMRSKWQARGKLGGQEFHLGTYSTPEEAARVAHEWRLVNLPGYTGRDIVVPKARGRDAA
jgi:hypothetical protein